MEFLLEAAEFALPYLEGASSTISSMFSSAMDFVSGPMIPDAIHSVDAFTSKLGVGFGLESGIGNITTSLSNAGEAIAEGDAAKFLNESTDAFQQMNSINTKLKGVASLGKRVFGEVEGLVNSNLKRKIQSVNQIPETFDSAIPIVTDTPTAPMPSYDRMAGSMPSTQVMVNTALSTNGNGGDLHSVLNQMQYTPDQASGLLSTGSVPSVGQTHELVPYAKMSTA